MAHVIRKEFIKMVIFIIQSNTHTNTSKSFVHFPKKKSLCFAHLSRENPHQQSGTNPLTQVLIKPLFSSPKRAANIKQSYANRADRK